MAVKISEKSCKVSFLKARDFWQDCSNRSGTEGILSSVCVTVCVLFRLFSISTVDFGLMPPLLVLFVGIQCQFCGGNGTCRNFSRLPSF